MLIVGAYMHILQRNVILILLSVIVSCTNQAMNTAGNCISPTEIKTGLSLLQDSRLYRQIPTENQIVEKFQQNIASKLKSPHTIEAFLYSLATDNGIVHTWKQLRKYSRRSYKDCFEIICKAIPPHNNFISFCHHQRDTQLSAYYPLIISIDNPAYKTYQKEHPNLMGPLITTYALASIVSRFPTLLNTLYDAGYATIPIGMENIPYSRNVQVIPSSTSSNQLFSKRNVRKILQKHTKQSNILKKILLQLTTRVDMPIHLLPLIYQYIPHLKICRTPVK